MFGYLVRKAECGIQPVIVTASPIINVLQKCVFQKGMQAAALQGTISIVLSVSRSSHQKVVISLNFAGFEFPPFVFPVQLFVASLVHRVMQKLSSTQHVLPMTALRHCAIRSLSKLVLRLLSLSLHEALLLLKSLLVLFSAPCPVFQPFENKQIQTKQSPA